MKRVLLALTLALAPAFALAQPAGLLPPGAVLGNPLTTNAPARGTFPFSAGTVNPMNAPFNAKCDGVTDDSAALQAAFNAVGSNGIGSVYIPPTQNGCAFNSVLYDTTIHGPILVKGDGPKSKLIVNNAVGGLTLKGSCGINEDNVYVNNIMFSNGSGVASAYALRLNGTAVYGMSNVGVDAGVQPFTKGLWLSGAQQGYISGGVSNKNTTGIFIDDCNFGSTAASNGTQISGKQFFDLTTAIDLEGAAGDLWIHDNHMGGAVNGIIINQVGGLGGAGPEHIYANHLEGNATLGLKVQAGTVEYRGNNDYNTHSIEVLSGARAWVTNNLLNGTVIFDLGSSGVIDSNTMNGSFTDNTVVAGAIIHDHNTGNGQPAKSTYWTSKAQFSTFEAVAGDILTLKPNPGIGGPWGLSITGTGGGTAADVYVSLQSGAIVGNAAVGGIAFKSAAGVATNWALINSAGLTIPAGSSISTPILTLPVGGTITQASGGTTAFYTDAGNTLLNVPTAGTLGFRVNNANVMSIGNPTGVVAMLGNVASTSSTTGTGVITGGLGVSGAGYFGAEIVSGVTVVASLPTCNAAHQGARMFVTDQNTAIAYHGAVTGGGTNKQGVTCDGTAWYQD